MELQTPIGPIDVGVIALGLAAAYSAYRIAEAYVAGHIRDLWEAAKEAAAVAIVLFAALPMVTTSLSWLPDAQQQLQTLSGIIREVYEVYVDVGQCLANLGLSGPLSPYASEAAAKLEPVRDAAQQALQMSYTLRGILLMLLQYGAAIVAVGLMLYGGWSRSIGAAIVALPLAYTYALALLLATQDAAALAEDWYQEANWVPVQAVGCDNHILREVSDAAYDDKTYLDAMVTYVSYGWWVIIGAPMAAGALYAALSRH